MGERHAGRVRPQDLPFAFFLKLLYLALDDAAFDRTHSLDEYLAIKMIIFMQNASRGQLDYFKAVLFSGYILELHQYLIRSADLFKETGKTQAALFTILLAGSL